MGATRKSHTSGFNRRCFLRTTVAAAATGAAYAAMPVGRARAQTELRILTMNLPFGEALRDEIAAEYAAETGVTIITDVTPYDALQEKVFLELGAGSSSYDIFTTDCIWVGAAINNGWALSVEDMKADNPDLPAINWDNVISAALPYIADLDGKRYGIPATLTTPSLIYRKDLFEKYGLKAPLTWDEYYDVLEKGKRALQSDGRTDTYPTTLIQASQDPGYSDWTFHLFGHGPIKDDRYILDAEGNPIFNENGRGAQALDELHRVAPYCPEGFLGFDYGEAANLYGSGKALMLLTWNDFYADMEKPSSPVAGLNGYVAVPRHEQQVNPVGGFQLFINANTEHAIEAYKFFAWMMAGRGFELIKEKGEKGILVKTDLSDPAVLAESPFLDTWNHIENSAYIPVWFEQFTEVQRIIWEEVAASLAGQASSEQAMQQAEDRVGEAMGR
jgi:ABC-type glycerol-3-phosphate transport system substrate-binding protein